MREALASYRTMFIVLLLTGLGFVLWVGGNLVLWLALRVGGAQTDYWTILGTLSNGVTAAALLSGAFVAYRQLSEVANARHLEVADRLFTELNAPEMVAARRWIFRNLPQDPEVGLRGLTEQGREAVKRVLNSLDRIAFLTQSGMIPERMVMPWMNPMIVKAWERLEPYVLYERTRRAEPDYYEHAEHLARRCVAWRRQNLPTADVTWLEDAL